MAEDDERLGPGPQRRDMAAASLLLPPPIVSKIYSLIFQEEPALGQARSQVRVENRTGKVPTFMELTV